MAKCVLACLRACCVCVRACVVCVLACVRAYVLACLRAWCVRVRACDVEWTLAKRWGGGVGRGIAAWACVASSVLRLASCARVCLGAARVMGECVRDG